MLVTTGPNNEKHHNYNVKFSATRDAYKNLELDLTTGRMTTGTWCLYYHVHGARLCADAMNGTEKETKLIIGSYTGARSKGVSNKAN